MSTEANRKYRGQSTWNRQDASKCITSIVAQRFLMQIGNGKHRPVQILRQVNHDILMVRSARKISGCFEEEPLNPLLSNFLLDD